MERLELDFSAVKSGTVNFTLRELK
jgi:hypothetical protein